MQISLFGFLLYYIQHCWFCHSFRLLLVGKSGRDQQVSQGFLSDSRNTEPAVSRSGAQEESCTNPFILLHFRLGDLQRLRSKRMGSQCSKLVCSFGLLSGRNLNTLYSPLCQPGCGGLRPGSESARLLLVFPSIAS